jgi:hypothetical protein
MSSSLAADFRRCAQRRDLTQLGGLALVGIAVTMLAYRFAHISLASFIRDEPVKLASAQAQLLSGTWVSSDGTGTAGVIYGPASLWFFRVVHQFFGPDPSYSILAVCVVATLTQLALAWALTDLFEGGLVLFAVLTAWLASSPYQFFWSRLAWEFGANAGSIWLVILMCRPRSNSIVRALVLGAVLGFMISSHLMVLPLVALAFAIELIEQRRSPVQAIRNTAVMLATLTLVNLPYFRAVLAAPRPASTPAGFHFSGSLSQLLLAYRTSTPWQIDYFFDDAWGDFKSGLGGIGHLLTASLAWTVLLAIISALGLVLVARSGTAEQRRVTLLALAAWFGYVGFYAFSHLDLQHPHYQWPVTWVPTVGLAAIIFWSSRRLPAITRALQAGVATLAALQFLFIVAWVHYTQLREGTRGIHMLSPLGEQVRAVQAVCSMPETALLLKNETALFQESLSYLFAFDKTCAGKRVDICQSRGCRGQRDKRHVTLSYAAANGGALRVD